MYDWPVTAGVILLLLAAASFAMLRMLLTIFGRRPGILIPLGIFLFCPLTLAGADWWSVAIEILPLEAATFMAVDAHVRYLRNGRLRTATAAAAWLAVGMAAMEKGAVVPLLLLALTVAYFVPRLRDVRRYWRAWAIYGGVLACYVAVFFDPAAHLGRAAGQSRLGRARLQPDQDDGPDQPAAGRAGRPVALGDGFGIRPGGPARRAPGGLVGGRADHRGRHLPLAAPGPGGPGRSWPAGSWPPISCP